MSRSLRSHTPGPRHHVGLVVGALMLLSLSAPTTFAKEGVEVSLAAPLPGDAEPGSTVTAVFNLKALTDSGESPLRGSPVFIRLYGPTGAMTQADGVEDGIPGTYRARIAIPAGGAARAEFGIRGSTTDASGATVASDIIWPYDGILVSAVVPLPVDPATFQMPGSKPLTDPAAQPADQPVIGEATSTNATGTGPAITIDARLVGLITLAALAMVGLGLEAGRWRRRRSRPA